MITDLHSLSGAYAMDALSKAEVEAFAKHLAECSACRDEVRELREVVSVMGASEAVAPPIALKARVLAAADLQAQLPPKVTTLESARSRRWRRILVGSAAAAIFAIVGAVGYDLATRPSEPSVTAGSVSQVFKADDAHVATFKTSDGQTLKLATSVDSGQLAIDTNSLRKLTANQVYQLWAVHNGRATSIGVLDDLKAGKVMPIPTYGTTVAITVEPAGGSKHPTREPIVEVNPQGI